MEGPWLERGAQLIGCCNPGQKKEEKVVALINSEVGMERLELIQETIKKRLKRRLVRLQNTLYMFEM